MHRPPALPASRSTAVRFRLKQDRRQARHASVPFADRRAAAGVPVSGWRADPLAMRVRDDFRELPGLRLSLSQACRLWGANAATCRDVLEGLVREGVLCCEPGDVYTLAAAWEQWMPHQRQRGH